MNKDTLIIEIYCRIEEKLSDFKLRSRGFPPKLTDTELITMEITGGPFKREAVVTYEAR